MKRLVLTSGDSAAGALKGAALADCVLPFEPRFAWGQLPSPRELQQWLAPRSRAGSTISGTSRLRKRKTTVLDWSNSELWIDPEPNAQLILIWLLDYFRPHERIVSKLNLVQADAPIGSHPSEQLAAWLIPAIKIKNAHLEIAGLAWQAYCAPTPQAWFNLLSM